VRVELALSILRPSSTRDKQLRSLQDRGKPGVSAALRAQQHSTTYRSRIYEPVPRMATLSKERATGRVARNIIALLPMAFRDMLAREDTAICN